MTKPLLDPNIVQKAEIMVQEGKENKLTPRQQAHLAHMSRMRKISGRLGGKPRTYKPSMAKKALDMLSDPYVMYPLRTVAAMLNVVPSTMNQWQDDHPEFKKAIERGLAIQEANAMFALQYNSSPTGLIFGLKNSAHAYKDKMEQSASKSLEQIIADQAKAAPKVDWSPPTGHIEQKKGDISQPEETSKPTKHTKQKTRHEEPKEMKQGDGMSQSPPQSV